MDKDQAVMVQIEVTSAQPRRPAEGPAADLAATLPGDEAAWPQGEPEGGRVKTNVETCRDLTRRLGGAGPVDVYSLKGLKQTADHCKLYEGFGLSASVT